MKFIKIADYDSLKTRMTEINETYFGKVFETSQAKRVYWLLVIAFSVVLVIWIRQGKPTTTGKPFDAPECIAKILNNTDNLQLKNISLDDISGEWKIPFHDVNYALLHLKMYQFAMATTTVQLTKFPNTVIHFGIEHGSFMMDGDYGFRYFMIDESGHFTGEATDIYLDLNLVVPQTNGGKIPVNIQDCTASVYHVSLSTKGKLAFVFNILLNSLKESVIKGLQSQLCSKIGNELIKQFETCF
ncbi:BPI fold-containing family C protein-like [Ciona intestinalis]